MTDSTVARLRAETNELRGIRRMFWIVVVLSVASAGIGGWLGYTARQENCENTHDAFRSAFQLLGEDLGASQPRIDRFLVKLDPILEDCA